MTKNTQQKKHRKRKICQTKAAFVNYLKVVKKKSILAIFYVIIHIPTQTICTHQQQVTHFLP